MPSAYSIPKIYEEEIAGAIAAGYYSNKSEVVRDALRLLFESRQELRKAAAIELYRREEATLGRASELAGMSSIEFKEVLADKGIFLIMEPRAKYQQKKQMELIKRLRAKK
ncbi:UPF0175 family protein [Candidatus Woesearchaeota archaeon]|nr:UPF0175 family protein [Candidatus Woesearchaeota archaeon]